MKRVLLILLALTAPAWAGHKHKKKARYANALQEKKHTGLKICSVKEVTKGKRTRKKKVCTYHHFYEGSRVAEAELRVEPLEHPSGDIDVRSDNLQEEAKVHIYKADGTLDDAALAQLDEIFRCRRTGSVRAVDPRLYEQLSRIYDHFGGEQIVVVSGFRNQQDKDSRHFHAAAMDIKIKGHTIDEIYDYAKTLDVGGDDSMGIGIYPNSGFVHIDYRAPGEKSTRWTDYSYPGSDGKASARRPPKKKHRR